MADVLDVISLGEAKEALHLSGPTQEPVLAVYVTALSRRLDSLCGPIVVRTVTERLDGGSTLLRLSYAPALTVTSVTEYNAGASQVLAAELVSTSSSYDYLLDGAVVHRRGGYGDARFASGRGNVVVVYQAGRYATTDVVDARFKLAARMMLRNFWRNEQGGGSQTFGASQVADPSDRAVTFAVPRAVLELLSDDLTSRVLVG